MTTTNDDAAMDPRPGIATKHVDLEQELPTLKPPIDLYRPDLEALRHSFEEMRQYVDRVNRDNGWHDDDRPFGTDIALLHSEVSEAYEEYRDNGFNELVGYKTPTGEKFTLTKGDLQDYTLRQQGIVGKPLGVPSELADILVRLIDTASRYHVDLAEEFVRKMRYNETRGYKHGGKVE